MDKIETDAEMPVSTDRSETARFTGTELSRREMMQITAGAVALAATSGRPARAAPAGDSLPATPSTVQLTINGQVRALTIDPRQSILDVLREGLQLTGTKKGVQPGRLWGLHGASERAAGEFLPCSGCDV